jgi:hypothetical protein
MGPDGGATVVWQRAVGSGFVIQAATMPPGKTDFGEPQSLSQTGVDAEFPQVGIAANGDTVVTWHAAVRDTQGVEVASSQAGGSFSAPQPVSDPDLKAGRPQLAVAANGASVVGWAEGKQAASHAAAAFASPGGPFGSEQVLEPQRASLFADRPEVAIDPRGNFTVVWVEEPAPAKTGPNLVRAAAAGSDGKIANTRTLDRTELDFREPSVAVSPTGAAVAAWITQTPRDPDPISSAVRTKTKARFKNAGKVTLPGASAATTALGADKNSALALWLSTNRGQPLAILASELPLR